jgi:hypothetical protein
VWACIRHPEGYRRIRAAFLGVTLAALAIHVAVPLAPPRMLRGEGFVDTLQVYGPRIYPADTTRSVANQFAAMPSLHFGWSVLVAAAIIALLRSRWRYLAIAHPAITLLAIVATANHYWLDAAVALVLVVVAGLVIRRHARRAAGRRPHAVAVDAAPACAGRGTARAPGAMTPGTRTVQRRRSDRQDVSRCWRR